MATIEKKWKKAGYLPGQYQKLTISFVSRNGNSVVVSYSLYVKSLGNDQYHYGTRHNQYFLYEPETVERTSGTYQLRGYPKNGTYSGSFTITNVGNATTELNFYYENKRIWVKHTNKSDPRSTGVVKKTHIGTLPIPANTLHTVTFHDVVNNKTYDYSCYHDNTFTIPNLQPSSNYYTFKGWTTTNYVSGYSYGNKIPNTVIEGASVTATSGKSITVTSNLHFYSVWRPRVCNYNLLNYKNKTQKTLLHTWNTNTKLLNLDKDLKCIVPGYNFKGWHARSAKGTFYAPTASCSEWSTSSINFYPEKTPQLNKVRFYTGGNSYKEYNYYTDAKFSTNKVLTDLNKTSITLNPGYKLVGWSTVPAQIMASTFDSLSETGTAFPNQGYSLKGIKKISSGNYYEASKIRIYPISGNTIFNYSDFKSNVLKLYPYYEYYTTTYVYYNGEWRLAMPYVYKDGKWNMALSYIYSSNNWKL